MNTENVIIYYHPTFGESTLWFRTEQEAFDFSATWHGMQTDFKFYSHPSLVNDMVSVESLTVVFN